jgi:TP901 family phage tail tape measure protein
VAHSGTLVVRLIGETSALTKSMGAASSKMAAAGAALTKKVTLPIAAIGAASVHMAADFEGSMDKIEGLVGISSKGVEELSNQVLDLAKTLPQSPKELSEALFFVTSAGFRGADAMEVLKVSAKAAAAGLGETKTVADAVTSAVNAYGIKNLSAAHATDILTATVKEGKTSAESVAPVLGNLLPLTSELGVGFDEVGAGIASMTRTGSSAAGAATSLTGVLNNLLKPTAAGKEIMGELGTSYEEVRKQIADKGLLPTLLKLRKNFEGLKNVNPQEAMAGIFGNIRGMRGFLSLTGKQAETNVGIFKRMADSTGVADHAFEAASQTTEFKLNVALNNLRVAAIQIGVVLLPVVSDMAIGFGKLIGLFSGLGESTKHYIVLVALLAAAVGPLLSLTTALIKPFVMLAKSQMVAAVAAKAYAAAQWLVNAALEGNPIVLVATALIALGVALVIAYKKSQTFRDIVNAAFGVLGRVPEMLSALGDAAIAAFGAFIDAAKPVLAWIKANWQGIVTVLAGPIGLAVALIITHWNAVKASVVAFLGWLKDHWKTVLIIIGGPLGIAIVTIITFWKQIKAAFETGLKVAEGVVKVGLALVVGLWQTFGGNLTDIVRDDFGMVVGVFRGVFKIVKNVFQLFTDAIKGDWSGVWNDFKGILSGAWDVLKSLLKGSLKVIWDTIKLWLKAWKTAFSLGWDVIKAVFSNALGLINTGLHNAFGGMRDFLHDLFTKTIPGIFRAGWDAIKGIFSGAVGTIKNLLKSAFNWILDKMLSFAEGLLDLADKAFGWIDPIGDKLDAAKAEIEAFRQKVNAEFDHIHTDHWTKIHVIPDKKFQQLVSSGLGHPLASGTAGRALGGPIWGGQAGRDSVPIMAMPGEHVWTTSEVRNAGGHGAMYALRDMAEKGALKQLMGFAAGGPVGGRQRGWAPKVEGTKETASLVGRYAAQMNSWLDSIEMLVKESALVSQRVAGALRWAKSQEGKPYGWGKVGPGAYDCSGFMSAITNYLRGMPLHVRVGSTSSFPWGGFAAGYDPQGFSIGSTRNAGGGIGHMAGTLGGVNVESAGGVGVRVGAGARGAQDGLFSTVAHLIGIHGTGKFTGPGDTGVLNKFEKAIIRAEAGSLNNVNANNPSSSAFGLGQLLEANRVKYARRLGFNSAIEHGDTGTTNKDHQIAMMRAYIKDRYGTAARAWAYHMRHGVYDTGGWLLPGATLAVNRTGRPERVSAPGGNVGPGRRFVIDGPAVIDIDGHQVAGAIRVVVREEIEDEMRFAHGSL